MSTIMCKKPEIFREEAKKYKTPETAL